MPLFVRSTSPPFIWHSKCRAKEIIRTAHKTGISTPIDNTPAMALGSSGVKVIDMAVAYSAIANGGYAYPGLIRLPKFYTKDGYPVYTRISEEEPQRILDSGRG